MTNIDTFQKYAIGRFTPPSVDDFVERARNVSRFLNLPRRGSEERVAKLYGYANAHEIRQAIATARSAGHEPGPYNSESSNHIFGKQPQRIDSTYNVERGNACLDMANEATGGRRDGSMTSRAWAFREIGMFDDIGMHRRKMREHTVAQDAIDVMEGRGPAKPGARILPPQDYATVKVFDGRLAKLSFTTLGEGLAEAISNAMNPDTTPTLKDRRRKLETLRGMHPGNPYVHAGLCINECYEEEEHPLIKRALLKKALVHYDAAAPLFDELYAAIPQGIAHDGTRCRSYMTPFEMDSSGMRIMCQILLETMHQAGINGRIRELRKRLAFFNVDRDMQSIPVD